MNLFFLFVSKVFFLAKQHRSIAFLPSTSITFCKLQVAIQEEKQKKWGKRLEIQKKCLLLHVENNYCLTIKH